MNLHEKSRDLYAYWKDIILFFAGLVLAFIPIVVTLYLNTPGKKSPVFPDGPCFIGYGNDILAVGISRLGFYVRFSFLREGSTGWIVPKEPLQWAEIQRYYKRYRRYILAAIAINVVFFIGLAGYVFFIEGNNISNITEATSGLILCSWMIMMGILAIFCCCQRSLLHEKHCPFRENQSKASLSFHPTSITPGESCLIQDAGCGSGHKA